MQGTYVDSNQTSVERLIENIRSPHASLQTQRQQLDLLQQLNAAHLRERIDPRLEARIESFELAYRMQSAQRMHSSLRTSQLTFEKCMVRASMVDRR